MVGTYEEKIFNRRSAIRAKKLRRLIIDHENSKQDEQDHVISSILRMKIVQIALFALIRQHHSEYCRI
ncbi:unnamed protein product [Lathyrus sativus]|nr:unnamed protein product [Lathyrus sativus]